MKNWIIVTSFTLPLKANLAKGKLQSQGIPSILKDELTVQADNFLSNAIGGVKLLVHENDYASARQILEDAGYLEVSVQAPPTWFDKATSNIPFIGKWQTEFRFMILGCIVLCPIILSAYWLLHPSENEILRRSSWCIQSVIYKGEEIDLSEIVIRPHLELVFIDGPPNCHFKIDFREGNAGGKYSLLTLPGLSYGRWYWMGDSIFFTDWYESFNRNLENDSTQTMDLDSLNRLIINRSYKVELRDRTFVLRSKHLYITGHKN